MRARPDVQAPAASAMVGAWDVSVRTPVRVATELVFEEPPFRFAHGASIAETDGTLLAVWFAGRHEGHASCAIWSARRCGGVWSRPRIVADAADPCWNPVLTPRADGALTLFHRIGPSPRDWRTHALRSDDAGETWRAVDAPPSPFLGPVRSRPVLISEDALLSPTSDERHGRSAAVETLSRAEHQWRARAPLPDPAGLGAIQPTIVAWSPTEAQALCRTRAGIVATSFTEDGGGVWSSLARTDLPNPDSAVDAVRTERGAVLIGNFSGRHRKTLSAATSQDGVVWAEPLEIAAAAREASYPAAIALDDGRIAVAFTLDRRRIAVAYLDV